jgi:hypothetical protein
MLSEWDVGSIAVPPRQKWSKKHYLTETQVAERLKSYVKTGLGAYRR